MDDLISRKALIDAINRDPRGQAIAAMRSGKVFQALTIVLEHIRTAPAVDAVEVVRCKDCKHSRERNEYEKAYLVEGVLICTHHACSDDCWFATWLDHWCSYGERRTDDE